MSVASVESIPDRFNALYDYEVLHMPKTQIAKRYGVCTSTVDGWVQRRNYFLNRVKDIVKIVDSGKFNYFFPGDKMETEKESEKELQRKIKYLEHKVQYLEALAEICDIDIANVTKKRYRTIRLAVERTGGNLTLFCSIANVNRKNYYSFLNQKEKTDDDELIEFIVTTQRKHHFGIGYRTMTSMIKNHFGETISQKKILRLMQENDVLSVVRRKRYKQDVYEKMKETLKNIPKNLLQRDFSAPEPNKVYVTDITYLYGRERIDYLSIIVDLYNKEIVAWQISKHPDKELCIETLNILASKRDLRGTIIHTDQGSSYLSHDFRNKVLELGMIQSCSARGECWDNAAMESVNGIIKTECLYNRFGKSKFKNRQIQIENVIEAVIPFIGYYNNERPKSELGGLPPVQFRLQNNSVVTAAKHNKKLITAAVF